MPLLLRSLTVCTLAATLAPGCFAGPTFSVSFSHEARAEPATGRLIVYLVRDGSSIREAPSGGPFWDDPQPLFGIDVRALAPDAAASVGDDATAFPVALSKLPAGRYRAQAVLDLHRDNSEWKREPGNLYSDTQTIDIDPGASPVFTLLLTHTVGPRKRPDSPGVETFETKSALLSQFRGHEVVLRAGVVLPIGYDAGGDRRCPAVYEVPGFGGDASGAFGHAAMSRQWVADTAAGRLARGCFWIVLDPESGNGHTLFADSANNGPCARALVEELIPALEARYKLIAQPSARLLRGHSSGGWSTLWLALNYPQTFGATWSTSPDPVDFHRFQLPDIYDGGNMYGKIVPTEGGAPSMTPFPSYRVHGEPKMSIEQENLMEEVLGPDNTSAQQWDSWQAVFGPRNDRGNPAALYDPRTGAIDKTIAEQYRKYDIDALLEAQPERFLPLFHDRARVLVGDQDSYYLNEAVALLKQHVEELEAKANRAPGWGFIKVLPGYDHGSIFGSGEMMSIPQEMVEWLEKAGHLPPAPSK